MTTREPERIDAPSDADDPWCIDGETRNAVIARRNILLGLWAGRLMGKSGEALTAYARELHRADFEVPGDADIVAKLSSDLATASRPTNEVDLRRQIAKFHKQAWRESGATD